MKGQWQIEVYDGSQIMFSEKLPGNLSQSEIEVVAQRLCCRYLSLDEIISSSVRRNHSGYKKLLDCRRNGSMIEVGVGVHVVAKWRKI